MGKGHMINADQLSPTVQSKPQSHGCFLDLGAPITITKAIDHFSWGNQCFWWTMFLESTLIVQQTVLKVALGPIVDHVKDTRAIATPLVSSMAKGPPHGFQKHPGLQPHEDLSGWISNRLESRYLFHTVLVSKDTFILHPLFNSTSKRARAGS